MNTEHKTAVWVITRGGLRIARTLKEKDPDVFLFLSDRFDDDAADATFSSLRESVSENFSRHSHHLFIMATGIVIRMIAGLIQDKTIDPAVVSMDDRGTHVISLLSGHLGGANQLAVKIADLIHAEPVISTATDVNRVPSIDMVASGKGLFIENPGMIKRVNMAFLEQEQISLSDPYGILDGVLPDGCGGVAGICEYGIVVDDHIRGMNKSHLYLRPQTLSVGIGCNRGTPESEIMALLDQVFSDEDLSRYSIRNVASIDIKQDETGILDLAENLGVPLVLFRNRELDAVETIKNSSETVKKYTGAKSVCEAAAILASEKGKLIVEKRKTKNVTLAVARVLKVSTS